MSQRECLYYPSVCSVHKAEGVEPQLEEESVVNRCPDNPLQERVTRSEKK